MNAPADVALLPASTPAESDTSVLVTNEIINAIHEPVNDAPAEARRAEAAHRKIPARLPLGQLHPGQ